MSGLKNSTKSKMDKSWFQLSTGNNHNAIIYTFDQCTKLILTCSVDCANHQFSTKHDENKYKQFAAHLQASIKEQFPQV